MLFGTCQFKLYFPTFHPLSGFVWCALPNRISSRLNVKLFPHTHTLIPSCSVWFYFSFDKISFSRRKKTEPSSLASILERKIFQRLSANQKNTAKLQKPYLSISSLQMRISAAVCKHRKWQSTCPIHAFQDVPRTAVRSLKTWNLYLSSSSSSSI